MLVLSRKRGEAVVITLPDGRRIWVSVNYIDRGRVLLDIAADSDIKILHGELVACNAVGSEASAKR